MENQKGYMGFILIAIVAMGIFLAGGLGKFVYTNSATNSATFKPIEPMQQKTQTSLQLEAIPMIPATSSAKQK